MNRGWAGLPVISKKLYEETYFLPDEDYERWVYRIANTYSNNQYHRDRIISYIKNYWFHPSTPISSNGGTDRGLPISCYVGEVADSKEGIFDSWEESCWLGSRAGGIGRDWSSVREMGAKVGEYGGTSSGVVPFMCVDGALTRAISQGNVRRMSQADYLKVSHPEIKEFIDIRKVTGDQKRRDQDLHHGVVIDDLFMQSVVDGSEYGLISPLTGEVVDTVDARELWNKILEARTQTGEPYLLFEDTVNRLKPEEYKEAKMDIKLSNLCTEIMLNTEDDKTNVCCLASINLEYFDEYKADIYTFLADCADFLDNVIQDFIDSTEGLEGFERARKAAIEERALGLGVMGFHSYLQSKHIPIESPMAKKINKDIFTLINDCTTAHNIGVEDESPLGYRTGTSKRNTTVTAIAPTMSISNLCNLASSGIEPWISNAFSKKLKQGTFPIRNKYLEEYINQNAKGKPKGWVEEQWESIKKHDGSVQHLDWVADYYKDIFKTAFEINQAVLLDLAADRTPLIDQGQSLNLFIPGNSRVQDISDLHMLAWKRGIKSLYYLRSTNPTRATTAKAERKKIEVDLFSDSCPSCT